MVHQSALSRHFTHLASSVAHEAGRPAAFVLCLAVVVAWAATGPLFGFSDTWQLIINTGTTIATFLMVFLIQNTQNRDGRAIQAKLDELILVSSAHNHFVGIEHLSDEEIDEILRKCEEEARRTGEEPSIADRARATREVLDRRRGGKPAEAASG
jgi:low affinity Fe/Cu permease